MVLPQDPVLLDRGHKIHRNSAHDPCSPKGVDLLAGFGWPPGLPPSNQNPNRTSIILCQEGFTHKMETTRGTHLEFMEIVD